MKSLTHLSLLALFCGPLCTRADADGGQIRANRRHGEYLVTVFTSPTPLRTGTIDVSVLIQDEATGTATTDVPVAVTLTSNDPSYPPIRAAATNAAATNKLLQAAIVELPAAGPWNVDVECTLPGEAPFGIAFTMDAAPPLPAWLSVWPWFGWPAVVVVLFAIHRWRVAGRRQSLGQERDRSVRSSSRVRTPASGIVTA